MNTDKFYDFVLQENQVASIGGYIEQIFSNLDKIRPASERDADRIKIIKQHLLDIRRLSRRKEEPVQKTEQQSPESV